MFQTYIIYSTSIDQYYPGYTSVSMEKRLRRHSNRPSTKAGVPWMIRYVKSFETKTEAIKWENIIKKTEEQEVY